MCIFRRELLLTCVSLSSSSGVRGTPENSSSSFRAEVVVFHTAYGEDEGLIATDVVEAESTNNFA